MKTIKIQQREKSKEKFKNNLYIERWWINGWILSKKIEDDNKNNY